MTKLLSKITMDDIPTKLTSQIAYALSPENAALFSASPELLEVVTAMANFDGRNNNTHLKEMAKAALKKATSKP